MLINIIMRKNFGFDFTLSKAKKKEKSRTPITGEAVGKKRCVETLLKKRRIVPSAHVKKYT